MCIEWRRIDFGSDVEKNRRLSSNYSQDAESQGPDLRIPTSTAINNTTHLMAVVPGSSGPFTNKIVSLLIYMSRALR